MAATKSNHRGTENLVPVSQRTSDELREMTRKGGIASGKARREKKTMRELLEMALQTPLKDKDGNVIKSPDDPRRKLTRKEAGMIEMAAKFANGDLKTIELAAKLQGELVQQVDVTTDITGGMALGFDPQQAIRELYGKEGGDE